MEPARKMLLVMLFVGTIIPFVSGNEIFPISRSKIDDFFYKRNCKLSEWSTWDGPKGFSGFERFRTIERYPRNGGKACPTELVQTKPGPKPTVKQTAKVMTEKFLRPGNQLSGNNRNKRQINGMKARDLLLIVDSSGSIGSGQFTEAMNDLANLIGLLCPLKGSEDPFQSSNLSYHQAAMIKFSTKAEEVFDFDDKAPTNILQGAIRSLSYFGGGTNTADAFRHAITMFASNTKGVRNDPRVQKEVLILTDGQSNNAVDAIKAANDLKSSSFGPYGDYVKVYGLIIGGFSASGQQEVKEYVSMPPGDHLFAVDNFVELDALVDDIKDEAPPCVYIAYQ